MDAALPDSVSLQLERILSRPPLATSPSLSRFLRFIVEETLAGRSHEITEYHLGVRVFNRGDDFNPRTDPIVRVQTHHLRSRLAQYYSKTGVHDPIVIELPARTYVPLFREGDQPAAAPEAVSLPAEQTVEPAAPAVEAASSSVNKEAPRRRGVLAPIAVSAVLLLGTIASVGVLGRSWKVEGHNPRHEANAQSQDLYIRGRYLLDRQSETAIRQAIESFQQAVTRDPQFAAAFAGIADANNLLVQYGFMSPREGMEVARRSARHALDLDAGLAEAYVSLGAISEAYDWDFKQAEAHYRHAIQLNSALPAAHLWYGMFLRDQERMPEAMTELRRAEQLEPLSVLANINLAAAFRASGDLNGALEHAKRALELNSELPSVNVMISNLYRQQSDLAAADALLTLAGGRVAGNPHALSALACTYARLGRRAESLGLLHQMEELAKHRYVSPYDMGNVEWMLGDEERAVSMYEEAYRQRSTGIVFLRNEKADSVKRSPRMQQLIRKLGNG